MNINITSQEVIGDISVLKIPIKSYKKVIGEKRLYQYIKRILDIIISAIAIIVLLPIFLIITIAIKLETKGPAIFKHTRVGKDGKIIKIYKFRTMVNNAEDMIKNLTLEQQKEFKEKFKIANDPRITKVGMFLRGTSLDELPQLLNIIKGDLSIIGPRPVIAEELKKYEDNIGKFLSITPGLTGYWAANGRSSTTYEQRMQMELYYIDNFSFFMDIKVFFKTILSVLKREGAV